MKMLARVLLLVWVAGVLFACSDDAKPSGKEAGIDASGEASVDVGTDAGVDVSDSTVDTNPTPIKSELIILHTNDLHSHLLGFSPNAEYTPDTVNDDATVGGYARLAAMIAAERAAAGTTPLLLLDGGDFLMGTPFPIIGSTRSAELVEMAKMGYDAIAIGNHEFDWGTKALADVINAAKANGFNVPLMATNMKFDAQDAADDDLEALMTAGVIKRKAIKTLSNGLKVGFIGFLGKDALSVAPASAPLTFDDISTSAKAAAADLRTNDGVDLVIAVSHSGTSADGQSGEDIDMASAVPDLDVIVSGHTHIALPKPTTRGKTRIVQSGSYGRYLGKLVLNIHEDGRTSVKSYELLPIDDKTQGDGPTQTRIDGYISEIDQVLASQGLTFKKVVAETAFDMPRTNFVESSLANLVTDSLISTVGALQPTDPPVFAVESRGDIRAAIVKGKTGQQWFSDFFRVLPLGRGFDGEIGYPVVTAYITPAEIKIVLEVTALAADLGNTDYFLHTSGVTWEYDSTEIPFSRVKSVKLKDGTALGLFDKSKCYKLVTTSYIFGLVGLLKTIGAPTVTPKEQDCKTEITDVKTRLVDGDPNATGLQELKEWQALMRYLQTFPDTNNNNIPDIPQRYQGPDGRIKCTGAKCPKE
ncbi:MAG: bifunctional metallophosphatase/5'-nucleotidase [Myxococcales bacterium]|nr:bifunctional metallophosphatase/5'-nucleotidase [Myxococcales bacterium]